jgi:hypothetical protein
LDFQQILVTSEAPNECNSCKFKGLQRLSVTSDFVQIYLARPTFEITPLVNESHNFIDRFIWVRRGVAKRAWQFTAGIQFDAQPVNGIFPICAINAYNCE